MFKKREIKMKKSKERFCKICGKSIKLRLTHAKYCKICAELMCIKRRKEAWLRWKQRQK